MGIEIAAVELGVGDDGTPRHFVERDVLRRQPRGAGDDHAMRHALGIGDGPAQRLHAAQRSAHDRGEAGNAQPVGHAGLRMDPVLDRDHGARGAVGPSGTGIDAGGPGGSEAGPQVVDPDHEEAIGVQRLARPHHVVPPAEVGRIVG